MLRNGGRWYVCCFKSLMGHNGGRWDAGGTLVLLLLYSDFTALFNPSF